MEDRLKEVSAVATAPLMERVELLKVVSMKRKFVDQVQELNRVDYSDVDVILGVVEHYKVLVILKGKGWPIRWIHRNDWVVAKAAELEGSGMTYQDAMDSAQKQADRMRQIFAD